MNKISGLKNRTSREILFKNRMTREILMNDEVNNVLQQHVKPAIRKEYRMMSDEERQKFQTAINRLKNSKIDGLSKYCRNSKISTNYRNPYRNPSIFIDLSWIKTDCRIL